MKKNVDVVIQREWNLIGRDFLIDPNRLVPFREALTADKIIQFIVNSEYFKYDSYLQLKYEPKTVLEKYGEEQVRQLNESRTNNQKINPNAIVESETISEKVLIYISAVRSLAVTWDKSAIKSYKKLLTYKPGLLTVELIIMAFYRSGFYYKSDFNDLLDEIETLYPNIGYKLKNIRRHEIAFLEHNFSKDGNFALKWECAKVPEGNG